jgi:hypothetical protein
LEAKKKAQSQKVTM